MLGPNPGLLRLWHWQADVLATRLDLIHSGLDLIHTRLDLIHLLENYYLQLHCEKLSNMMPMFAIVTLHSGDVPDVPELCPESGVGQQIRGG
jgi:hypothetical protein